ncbi:Tachykinin-like peptides receptor 99D [Amphibalanus amphitrite]|uniref:Tachykinin-like peptides receptor 99D n=1 Tax=Amphibalanus amphitrite TaxID=1232801 RepID=A0A6A4X3M1_AMPAM|nr:Tachykinin-like peptides receptor 99D [Amphibalanus amphitrite]
MPYCDYQGVDRISRNVYFYARVSCQYFIPLVVLSFCYCRVGCEMWGSRVPGNADNQRDAVLLNNKRKVLKMLVIVVVMFVICWLPFQLFYVVFSIFPNIGEFRYINVIFFCSHWLAMANSCCNPFIYGIYNEKFKREFKNKFQKSICHEGRYSMEPQSSDMENGSEELRSRFSLQRSLRNKFLGASTKTTLDRAASVPGKELEPLAGGGPPINLTGPD